MIWLWILFLLLILAMLALDLGLFHRESHEVGLREALIWTGVWVATALAFNVFIYFLYEHRWFDLPDGGLSGRKAALQYLTGYVLEKSLSVDNIFVIALVFSYFAVPGKHQHRVLFWGILGALVMRGIMIAAGVSLIRRFEWITYVFGALLLLTALKMLLTRQEKVHPDRNPLVRLVRRLYPVTSGFREKHFFVREGGRLAITPLFISLIVVESTDLLFAVDSIPAILAVTRDPFIVFTSNVFAILGLRSLYFALAGMMNRFRYLKYSLVFVLAFVGVKMLLAGTYHLPVEISLAVIATALTVGVVASLRARSLPGDSTS